MFVLRRLARKLEKQKARQKIIDDKAEWEEQKRLDRLYLKMAVEKGRKPGQYEGKAKSPPVSTFVP